MKKRIKTGGALILAAVLAISAFAINNSFAANRIEDRTCKLTVDVSNAVYKEVKEKNVSINLYKVADISATGEYTVSDSYKSVLNLSDIGPDLAANKWEEKALAVKGLIDSVNKDDVDTNDIPSITPDDNTKYVFTNLAQGMYLFYPETLETDYYKYEFTPSLISLPDNRFYTNGNDDWVYEVTAVLKPEKSELYGDLLIGKTVDVFNESLGEANFVFQVEAEKTDIDTNETKKVYSNVVSLSFDGADTKYARIEDIPAGSVVTVTEVYSGASYKLVGSEIIESAEEDGLVIIADGDEKVAEIVFLNTYNGGLNGGNGLVNNFTYSAETGKWTHQATEDSVVQ